MENNDEKYYGILKRYWGYDQFRGQQLEVIRAICSGHDTLALMPTGAGKSLTYQIPGLLQEGVCIVVSPLIALMKDQVDALRRRGISATAIWSGMTSRQIDIALDNCVFGDTKFLYLAPERAEGDLFMSRLGRMKVNLIAVDEAHCISQWGYDFRPSYLKIARMRDIIPDVPVLALTASATELVAEDIRIQLRFSEGITVRSDLARPNLSFAVRQTDDKREQLLRILRNVSGSGIVYLRSRKGCEQLTADLQKEGISALFYHAGLPGGERSLRQEEWQSGKVRVMVATNAFGMGIDKPDVRFVIHYTVCSSLEEYYQEAGRAGRDGKRSYAVMLVSSDEPAKAKQRLRSEFPDISTIKECYERILTYLQIGVGDGKFCSFPFDLYDFCARNGIFSETVRNALKILQMNGYLIYTDETENPARLMFRVNRDDLYNIRLEHNGLDVVIQAILRLYTGVFSDFRNIDTQEIAQMAHLSDERVKEMLKSLWRLGIIRYIPRNQSPMVFLCEARIPVEDIFISPKTYIQRKEAASRRMEHVFRYIDNRERCRSAMLQEYFGQHDTIDCGCCDNCLERKKKDREESADESLRQHILRILHENPRSIKELSTLFTLNPQRIVTVVDSLLEEGKIVCDTSGILTINR